MSKSKWKTTRFFVLGSLLATGIFVLDISLPLGVAGGVPYVALVLVSLRSPRRRHTLVAATAGTALTILGFFFSPPGGVLWMVIFNRGLALFVIWITAILGSQQKRAQETVRAAQGRLDRLVSSSPAVIYSGRPSGDYGATFISENVFSQMGYKAREFLEDSRFWIDRIHSEDAPHILAELPRLFEREHHILEYRFRHKNGTYRWMRDEAKLLRDPAGNPVEIVGSWIDVTERKRAEEALRESEERFRKLFEEAQLAMGMVDKDLRLVRVNPAYCQMLGYTDEELSRLSIHDITHPDDLELNVRLNEKLIKGEIPRLKLEKRYVRKNGDVFWGALSSSVVCDDEGNFLYTFGTVEDITERKRAEEALRKNEASLAEAQRIAHLGSWDWDVVGNKLHWSDETFRIFGFAPQQFAPDYEKFLSFVHPEDREFVDKSAMAALQGKPYSIEHRIVRADGSIGFMHSQGEVTLDESRRPIRLMGTALDITERKQAEQALRFTQFAMDRTPLAAYWMGPDARFFYVNDAASAMLGYTREELLSMTVHDIDPDYPKPIWPDFWSKLRQRGSFTIEAHHRTKDGRIFPVEIAVNYLEFDGKEYNCSLVRDISERKQAEEQIQASLKEKEVLLQEIHHRVKNNLQVISSLLSLQAARITDRQAREMFTESRSRVRSIALMHEVLYRSNDLSRVDFGEYSRSLAANLFTSYGADPKAISLRVSVEDGFLGVDAAIPCGLIVSELISNSLKYAFPAGKHGEICIDFQQGNGNKCILVVKDDGIGLPKGLDFRKPKSLGLQLVYTLTDQLGGTIELDRTGGTEFRIAFVARRTTERDTDNGQRTNPGS